MSLPNYRRRKPGSSTSNLQSKAHEFENVAQSASQGRASEKPEQVPKKKQKKTEECSLPELKDAELCSKEQAKKYLRDFDLIHEYGPCMNITRSERYNRAVKYRLNPPESVIYLLYRFRKEDPGIEECVWSQYVI